MRRLINWVKGFLAGILASPEVKDAVDDAVDAVADAALDEAERGLRAYIVSYVHDPGIRARILVFVDVLVAAARKR